MVAFRKPIFGQKVTKIDKNSSFYTNFQLTQFCLTTIMLKIKLKVYLL